MYLSDLVLRCAPCGWWLEGNWIEWKALIYLTKMAIKQLSYMMYQSLQQLFQGDVISPEQEISASSHPRITQISGKAYSLECLIETIQAVIQNSLRSMQSFPITFNSFWFRALKMVFCCQKLLRQTMKHKCVFLRGDGNTETGPFPAATLRIMPDWKNFPERLIFKLIWWSCSAQGKHRSKLFCNIYSHF